MNYESYDGFGRFTFLNKEKSMGSPVIDYRSMLYTWLLVGNIYFTHWLNRIQSSIPVKNLSILSCHLNLIILCVFISNPNKMYWQRIKIIIIIMDCRQLLDWSLSYDYTYIKIKDVSININWLGEDCYLCDSSNQAGTLIFQSFTTMGWSSRYIATPQCFLYY